MSIEKPVQSGKMGTAKGDTTMTARYINPYTDFGFKKLFGEEASKGHLVDFLNAVLPEPFQVADLTFSPGEQLPDHCTDRKAIFDIACVSPDGRSFIVEMQKVKQRWFKDRALFYASHAIRRQAVTGDWNFRLNPVIFVAILDFEYDKEEEYRELHREVSLKDQNGAEFVDSLRMSFLQMPLFTKTESELETREDKWLYFLKNLESFNDIPAILREPVFESAFDRAEYLRYTPDEQEAYFQSQMAYWDNINTFKYAVETAAEEGEARGEARGRADVARNLKQKGLPTSLIAETTGLSEAEIGDL